MSRILLITIVVVSFVMAASCGKVQKTYPAALLEKSWTQSYEEKISDNIEVYRPSDSQEFPVSRYRQVFKFDANRQCEYLILSNTDGHYLEKGNWDYDDKANSIKIFNLNSKMLYEFEIVELENDVLKLTEKN